MNLRSTPRLFYYVHFYTEIVIFTNDKYNQVLCRIMGISGKVFIIQMAYSHI